jgi:hypothetical protein
MGVLVALNWQSMMALEYVQNYELKIRVHSLSSRCALKIDFVNFINSIKILMNLQYNALLHVHRRGSI